MQSTINLSKCNEFLHKIKAIASNESKLEQTGYLIKSVGLVIEVIGIKTAIGTKCEIILGSNNTIDAVVTGFTSDKTFLMPLSNIEGLEVGCKVKTRGRLIEVPVGDELLGRVIDAIGMPLDGKPKPNNSMSRSVWGKTVNPLARERITNVFDVGVKAINGLLTIGEGQRLGLFAGSGVGKSVLLGMIARFAKADVIVVGLIGERGREVKEFIEVNLGEEGLKKAVVVATPADYSAALRFYGALSAVTIAEYFRDQGKKVLLLMDSLTRYAQAQREIALAMGEPPATKGYTPSVFKLLPQLVERAGMGDSRGGSITALFTVLMEGDDNNDPVVDSARAILDGHIKLSRRLADLGHYPAIEINGSVSRVMNQIIAPEANAIARLMKKYCAIYEENEDLINIGAYVHGANKDLDFAVKNIDQLKKFLQQEENQNIGYAETLDLMHSIFNNNATINNKDLTI